MGKGKPIYPVYGANSINRSLPVPSFKFTLDPIQAVLPIPASRFHKSLNPIFSFFTWRARYLVSGTALGYDRPIPVIVM